MTDKIALENWKPGKEEGASVPLGVGFTLGCVYLWVKPSMILWAADLTCNSLTLQHLLCVCVCV